MPFPLPLTPLEFYYYSDHRQNYPMTVPIDLRFSGQIFREPFLASLRQTVERHPLLNARISNAQQWPQWVPGGEPMPYVDWADESVPLAHPSGDVIDLTQETGLRVFVRAGTETARVLLHMHHACCDGVAALRVVEDLMTFYAHAVERSGTSLHLPELHAARLADRACFGEPPNGRPPWSVLFRDVWITASEWWTILRRNPAVVANRTAIGDGLAATSPGRDDNMPKIMLAPGILEYQFVPLGGQMAERLRQIARAQGATLNDLLMRDVMLAVLDWNRSQSGDVRKTITLNVPVNLRDHDEGGMPAANRIGFSFVSQTPRQLSDRRAALAAIHAETQRIKYWKLGLYFLGGLTFASNLRGVVPWALRQNRSFATMVCSSLGRIFTQTSLPHRAGRVYCGNLVLERFLGVPPVRPLTTAAMAIFEYAEGMTICLRCDPLSFDRGDTAALLETYLSRLNQTIHDGT